MNYLFTALIKKLEGEVEVAKANLLTYQRNKRQYYQYLAVDIILIKHYMPEGYQICN